MLTTQLLHGAEEWDLKLVDKSAFASEIHIDVTIIFVGQAFSRICRRGSAGILIFLKPEAQMPVNLHILTCTK